jgi:hypothetical protein
MLHAVGVPAFLAYHNPRPLAQMTRDVPCLVANHCLVLVPAAGKDHWIDVDYLTERWDDLRDASQDCYCLVVRDQGEPLLTTPTEPHPESGPEDKSADRDRTRAEPEEGWSATLGRLLGWGVFFLLGYVAGRWLWRKPSPSAAAAAPPAEEEE